MTGRSGAAIPAPRAFASRARAAAPIVLAAHGSRDPASAATMNGLAAGVGRLWPAPVVAAFLDFDLPTIPDALRALPEGPTPIVVPALLTDAYHGRVDLPAVLAEAGVPARLAAVLGPALPGAARQPSTPDRLLVASLRRRLSELDGSGTDRCDGLVLLAAGTSQEPARSTVEAVAAELGRQLNVACVSGYASASRPTGGEAVAAVRASGATRILAASYFLAPGRLYSAAAASARAAGADEVAAPLGVADELVSLILARATAASVARLQPMTVRQHEFV